MKEKIACKNDPDDESRTDLAEQRTDGAEDRTILASERTYGGWMRTGVAAMALGLGFNAIFKQIEPTYLAKAASTLFIIIGLIIFVSAYRIATAILRRIESHAATPVRIGSLRLITALFVGGGCALGVLLWVL